MNHHPLADKVAAAYSSSFPGKFIVSRAPGRVNIIGEHTDYNEGFVLPGSINYAAFTAVGKRDDKIIKLISLEFNETYEYDVEHLLPGEGWPNYILGVADQLIKRGYHISGFNLVLAGDVPIGSGMSSSASLECATVIALDHLFDLKIDKREMAEIAQKAEHTFAKVMCGIMDQFASLFGKKDHVIKLDCRSLEYDLEPFKLDGYSILLLNTNVSHSLASSEYNQRRAQCEKGAAVVQQKYPHVKSLRDVSFQMLTEVKDKLDEETFRRCKYVIGENERLHAAVTLLENNDLKSLGKYMYASHDGLSKEYNVSCIELDFLVDFVRDNPAVIGARMMGGGFGGCTINIVKNDEVNDLIQKITPAYLKAMGRELTPIIALTDDGASVIMEV